MEQAEGLERAKTFYKTNLPFGMARYVDCGWRSLADAEAEFCFEPKFKGNHKCVCIVLHEKQLTGSQEDLERFLKATLEPSFHNYQQCKKDYGLTDKGHGSSGPRKWRREN